MTPDDLARLTRVLLLALLLAGCARAPASDCRTRFCDCLRAADAVAEGAPHVVTRVEARRWCWEDEP